MAAFPFRHVRNLLGLAAYLCERPHSSMEDLSGFINKNMLFLSDPKFDRRRAGELLLDPVARSAFYRKWIRLQGGKARQIFYDVTSYSTYSGQIIKAEYGHNRDNESLRQINEGLFCCRETGLPLFMTTYSGSINDAANFRQVLAQATDCNLKPSPGRTVMIMDGGFSRESFNWLHLLGWRFICGVSPRRISSVREACMSWSASVSPDAEATSGRRGTTATSRPACRSSWAASAGGL